MNLYEELSEYTGLPLRIVTECSRAAGWFLAKDWDPTDVLGYYRKSDLYIYDLSFYQQEILGEEFYRWFCGCLKTKPLRGLDLGGGIGEYTIQAMKLGHHMDFIDVDGETLKYAKWRFNKHGVNPEIHHEDFKIDKDYDFIVAMDVLEHLENPDERIKELAEHTQYVFANPDQVAYSVLYPQHISKYDLTPYFENTGNLWKRK